jgi:hypothetical protein
LGIRPSWRTDTHGCDANALRQAADFTSLAQATFTGISFQRDYHARARRCTDRADA